jgi:ribose-phosphate pyrophosphokinase
MQLFLDEIKSLKFSGGEIHVQLSEEQIKAIKAAESVDLYTRIIKNSDDLMKTMLVGDAIYNVNRDLFESINLITPYLPYARQDRVCTEGQANSQGVLISILARAFNTISATDIHNPKSTEFSDINVVNIMPTYENLKGLGVDCSGYFAIIAPDKGAIGRAAYYGDILQLPVVQADKVRDPSTGHIISYQISKSDLINTKYRCPDSDNNHVLVVDDICDGGKTFELLGEELKNLGYYADLYVTHGIFSKGKDLLNKYYGKIYSYYDWTT